MKILLAFLVLTSLGYAATIAPCEQIRDFNMGNTSPSTPLGSPPPSGVFACGGLEFSDFSDSILNGGLLGATFAPHKYDLPYVGPGPGGFNSNWIYFFLEFPVGVTDFSFVVRGTPGNPLARFRLFGVDAASGNPTVDVHFGDVVANPGQLYAHFESRDLYGVINEPLTVYVTADDVSGGTIGGVSMQFMTPEPSTFAMLALAISAGVAIRRRVVAR